MLRGTLKLIGIAVAASLAAMLPVEAKPLMAISEITFADTSGVATESGHSSLLKALAAQISKGIGGSELYDTKVVARANCEDYSAKCTAKWARGTGGNLILIGTVLKTAPNLSSFWVGIFRGDGATRIYYKSLTIEGDSAGAWSAAGKELIADVLKARPGL